MRQPSRICHSDLKNEVLAWSAIGANPTAMRVDPLDLKREDIVPAHKALPVQLSPDHERELNSLVPAHSTPQKLAERARIILLAADGQGIGEMAQQLGICGARRPLTRGVGGATRIPRPR
jgi:hypothetical protein